jgi:hypothetical protein
MIDPRILAFTIGVAEALAFALAITFSGYMTLVFLAVSGVALYSLRIIDRFHVHAANAKLRVRHHQVFLRILDSGDGLYDEDFRDVEPYRNAQVSEIRGFVESEYGYFGDPVYTPNGIVWKWERQEGDKKHAITIFNPPLVRGNPRDYQRTRRTFNMVYFNQQDRKDSLWNRNGDVTREAVWFGIRHAYDDFFIQVEFPPDHFPRENVSVEAVNMDNRRVDQSETARAGKALTFLTGNRILQLRMQRPLCGLEYRISWGLPRTEADEAPFTADQLGFCEDAAHRLSMAGSAVREASNDLRKILREHYADDCAAIILYTYRRQAERGGLWPVADTDLLLDSSARSDPVVRLGRTLLGQSYRRRCDVLFSTFNHEEETGYEPLPAFNSAQPVFAIAVPILSPEPRGLRLGVVYVQSHALKSGLNVLVGNVAAKTDFITMVRRWHVQRLMPAIYPEFSGRKPDELPWLWDGKHS